MLFPMEMDEGQRKVAACPAIMGGAGNLDLIYYLCEHLQARRVVETGVASGWSSLAILLSIQNRADGRLVSTDMPYSGVDGEAYVGQVVPEVLRRRWRLIPQPDRKAIPMALDELASIDFCHYDSAKSYAA